MGISVTRPTAYDRIGLKPDDREINTPPVTHLVATVDEAQEGPQPCKLRTVYTRISSSESDTSSDVRPDSSPNARSGLEPI
jgi:hypothetical protein